MEFTLKHVNCPGFCLNVSLLLHLSDMFYSVFDVTWIYYIVHCSSFSGPIKETARSRKANSNPLESTPAVQLPRQGTAEIHNYLHDHVTSVSLKIQSSG